MNSHHLLLLPLLLIGILSCEKKPPVDLGDAGFDYFPLEPGRYWIYQVDSVHYDDYTNDSTHHSFQIREQIESTFIDGENRVAFRIERHRRDSTNGLWSPVGVRVSVTTPVKAEKVEENLRFIKLAFPLYKNKKWDGNAMNEQSESMYAITGINEAREVGTLIFDSTCTVKQADFVTLIRNELKTETYAKGVGMIYRRFTELETSITGIIERGYHYEYSIIEYGKQ